MIPLHDLPEVIITDFTPTDGITSEDKAQLEILAMRVIAQSLPNECELVDMVREYVEQKTPESHWLHDIDKLDAVKMALRYEVMYPEKVGIFREFLDYAKPRLKTEEGKEIVADLEQNELIYRAHHRKQSVQGAGSGMGQ